MNKGLLTSKCSDWATPLELFSRLDAEFHFTLDVCATASNAKVSRFYSPEDDGLSKVWDGTCWMNPPYGREISNWVKKAYEESRCEGVRVVALVPARTDTAWWQDWVAKAEEIRFLRGRVRFEGGRSCAPFPSAVIVFAAQRRNQEATMEPTLDAEGQTKYKAAAIAWLEKSLDPGDKEHAHKMADNFLLDALMALGHEDIVEAWEKARDRCEGFWYI